MTEARPSSLSPATVPERMKKNGVTRVEWLPDTETNCMYLLVRAEPGGCCLESVKSWHRVRHFAVPCFNRPSGPCGQRLQHSE